MATATCYSAVGGGFVFPSPDEDDGLSFRTPHVESFVLRFVQEAPAAAELARAPGWHGVVRHVQTNQEEPFTQLTDAIAFIARYVSVGDFNFKGAAVPKVKANGIELHYEVHGSGEPLVLIGGLGADTFLWFRQIPELCKYFQVIAFDNRGAGESDKPEEPYTIPMFAADTAGLLTALGIRPAHVVGASLGGLIAQEFALTYPAMVNRLVLVSTTFGGPHQIPTPKETLTAMLNRTGDPETDIRNNFKLFTSQEWQRAHPEIVDQYVQWRVAHPQPPAAYQRQALAVAPFNAEERVSKIAAPTLVAHGADDRVVPVENARLLAGKIPHSQLMIFPGGGHAFTIEMSDEFNAAVVKFLQG
jgi:pimeloyl-ACP methyl ester carboxylesterase